MKKSLIISTIVLSLLISNIQVVYARGGGGTGGTSAKSSSSSSSKASTPSKPSVNLSKPSTTTPKATTPSTTKPSISSPNTAKQPSINNNTTKVYQNNTLHIYSVPSRSYYYGGYYHPAYIPYWYHPYYYNPWYWGGFHTVPVATSASDYVFSFIFTGLLFAGIMGGLGYWLWRRRKF